MSRSGGQERSPHDDPSQEKITLSLPAEFFQLVSDEFDSALRLLDSQQAVLHAAEAARRQEEASAENQSEIDDADRLNRLVRNLLGKGLDELQLEQAGVGRRSYSVASAELYHAAELLGAQARHRLDRLALAFDQIAGDPVRRELARREIEQSAKQRGVSKKTSSQSDE